MKFCNRCLTAKTKAAFNNNKARRDGKQTYCRECEKTDRKDARYVR